MPNIFTGIPNFVCRYKINNKNYKKSDYLNKTLSNMLDSCLIQRGDDGTIFGFN